MGRLHEQFTQCFDDVAARVTTVRWADADSRFDITFDFDGEPYHANLRGRNADLILTGGPTDARVAVRALLDGDAFPR